MSSIYAQTFVEQKKMYPVTLNEEKRVVTGFQSFTIDDNEIFANALMWAINNLCERERNTLFDINVAKKEFSFNATFDYIVSGKPKYQYIFKGNMRIVDRKLVYNLYDIEYKTNSILNFSSTSSIDKLSPEKKQKQKEIISAFQELESKMLNSLFDVITEKKCSIITHWDDINIQRPVKGMNEDECLLAFGKPNNIYEDNNNRTQWSYGLNFVLIFKNGLLETIIR